MSDLKHNEPLTDITEPMPTFPLDRLRHIMISTDTGHKYIYSQNRDDYTDSGYELNGSTETIVGFYTNPYKAFMENKLSHEFPDSAYIVVLFDDGLRIDFDIYVKDDFEKCIKVIAKLIDSTYRTDSE